MLIPQLLSSLSKQLKKPVTDSRYKTVLASAVRAYIEGECRVLFEAPQLFEVNNIRVSRDGFRKAPDLLCKGVSPGPTLDTQPSSYKEVRELMTRHAANNRLVFDIRDVRIAVTPYQASVTAKSAVGKDRLETSIPTLTVVQRESSKDDFI